MKFLKSAWKTCLAAVIGFLLGVGLTYIPAAKAQGNTRPTFVYKLDMNDAGRYRVGTVVGFSCVLGPGKGPNHNTGETECYMATQ